MMDKFNPEQMNVVKVMCVLCFLAGWILAWNLSKWWHTRNIRAEANSLYSFYEDGSK